MLLRRLKSIICSNCTIRSYSTQSTFVPPPSLRDIDNQPRFHRRDHKIKPSTPTFYTSRASYYDQLIQLENALSHTRHALTHLQLLPLPAFARAKLEPRQPVWKQKEEMTSIFNIKLTTARYRRVTSLLNQLNDYHRIATTAGCYELGLGIASVLEYFERDNKAAVLARGKTKPVQFDKYGRTYTVGRRKTSAARVWMIPVQQKETDETQQQQQPAAPVDGDTQSDADMAESLLGLEAPPEPQRPINIPTTTVLVNNIPLAEYFPIPADRDRILRPFKVGGVLGAFNVFALVRGGGTSGQSGAIALGVAKGLAAHEPTIEPLLRKAKLLRRDPRMVERKKTGLAKARKRYTWVKR